MWNDLEQKLKVKSQCYVSITFLYIIFVLIMYSLSLILLGSYIKSVKRACSDLEPVFYIKFDYRRTLWNPVLNHNLSFLFFKLYHKTNCMYVICSDPESSFFVKGQGHCRPQHKIHLLNPIVLLLTLSAVCIIHRLFGQGWAIIVHLMIRWRLSSKQNCLNYAFHPKWHLHKPRVYDSLCSSRVDRKPLAFNDA